MLVINSSVYGLLVVDFYKISQKRLHCSQISDLLLCMKEVRIVKEINIGRILIENRHKKGITQEELAEYIGVSKAAVSKWETQMTYPDIALLPRLAAYFDISIDELMGYRPQMTKEEIREWYCRFTKEFSDLPFDEVLEHCLRMARKYYSCYLFLFHIGILLVNHFMLAETIEKSRRALEEARGFFQHVKNGTDDPGLGKKALQMEAYCWLALKCPEKALEIMDKDEDGFGSNEPLMAAAYQMTGNLTESGKILQIGIYKNIVSLCNLFSSYMNMSQSDDGIFGGICKRFQAISDVFDLDKLHPGIILPCYLAMAQGWAVRGKSDRAFLFLEKYTDLATGDIYPLRLHGDIFFNMIDEWLGEVSNLGNYPPRDESVIRRSMTQALTANPAFKSLRTDSRFKEMFSRLKDSERKK